MKCSKKLLIAAKRAAKTATINSKANADWVRLFEAEYGHVDISDILVDCVDFSTDEGYSITAEFIHEHSKAGES